MQTAVQHAELMKKVETLNLLQDSNRMLREERDRAIEKITELEKKVFNYYLCFQCLVNNTGHLSSRIF